MHHPLPHAAHRPLFTLQNDTAVRGLNDRSMPLGMVLRCILLNALSIWTNVSNVSESQNVSVSSRLGRHDVSSRSRLGQNSQCLGLVSVSDTWVSCLVSVSALKVSWASLHGRQESCKLEQFIEWHCVKQNAIVQEPAHDCNERRKRSLCIPPLSSALQTALIGNRYTF